MIANGALFGGRAERCCLRRLVGDEVLYHLRVGCRKSRVSDEQLESLLAVPPVVGSGAAVLAGRRGLVKPRFCAGVQRYHEKPTGPPCRLWEPASRVRPGRLELPRRIPSTRPSTLRVYQ